MRKLINVLALSPILAAQVDHVKQARRAQTAAEKAAAEAGKACKANEYEECQKQLQQTQASVEETKQELDQSGINPGRSPRHFKDAEIRTRKILKLLRAMAPYIHPEDQNHYEGVVRRISEINDQLLSAIMSKKKKK